MLIRRSLAALTVVVGLTGTASAQFDPGARFREGWIRYSVAGAGTSVDVPADLFPVRGGQPPEGTGERFVSRDGAATLVVYALANEAGDSPRSYVERNLRFPRSSISYAKITDRFFVVSGVRSGRVFYTRCNFARVSARMHCVHVAYPQEQKRGFDQIVSRISLSLRG